MGPITVASTRPRWGMSMVCNHWESRSPETAYGRALATWPGGDGESWAWQYSRRLEAAAGAPTLVSRQWSPPPPPLVAAEKKKNDYSKDMQQSNIFIRNVSFVLKPAN